MVESGLGCGTGIGGDVEAKQFSELFLPRGWHRTSLAAHLVAWPSRGLQDQLSAVLSTCNPWEPHTHLLGGRVLFLQALSHLEVPPQPAKLHGFDLSVLFRACKKKFNPFIFDMTSNSMLLAW